MPQDDRELDDLVRDRLRALRIARGWTLDDLAARSHLGPSTISRIETGPRRLALDQLRILADALDVSIDKLVEPAESDHDVVIRPEKHRSGTRTVWQLSRPDMASGASVAKVRLEPRATRAKPQVHPGRDWFYVLSGTVLLTLGSREVLVHHGHAADFDTMVPHAIEAHLEPTELISIFDPSGRHTHLGGA